MSQSNQLLLKESRSFKQDLPQSAYANCEIVDQRSHVYFNLGAVLFDSSQWKHYQDHAPSERKLLLHSRILADNPEVLDMVIRNIYIYAHKYSPEAFQQEIKNIVTQAELPIENEEVQFVAHMLEYLKQNLGSKLIDLLRTHNYKRETHNNIMDIVFSEIRFTRLLPLFHILFRHKIRDSAYSVKEDAFIKGYPVLTSMKSESVSIESSSQQESIPSPSQDEESEVTLSRMTTRFYMNDTPSLESQQSYQESDYQHLGTYELELVVRQGGYKPACRDQMIEHLKRRHAANQQPSPLQAEISQHSVLSNSSNTTINLTNVNTILPSDSQSEEYEWGEEFSIGSNGSNSQAGSFHNNSDTDIDRNEAIATSSAPSLPSLRKQCSELTITDSYFNGITNSELEGIFDCSEFQSSTTSYERVGNRIQKKSDKLWSKIMSGKLITVTEVRECLDSDEFSSKDILDYLHAIHANVGHNLM